MDDRLEQHPAESSQSSKRTAKLKVELDYTRGEIVRGSIARSRLIERAAHKVGLRVSRMAQEIPMDRLAGEPAPEDEPATGSRQIVATTLGYLRNNRKRMKYTTTFGRVCSSLPLGWNQRSRRSTIA